MKPRPAITAFLFNSTWLATAALQAATLYWDNNTATAGFGTAGGTWSSAGSNLWNQDPLGATANGGFLTGYATTTADNLNFGTAATGLAGGTVTVSGTVNAGTMTFGSASGNLTFSGGTINLAPAFTINTGGKTITLDSNLAGAATSVTYNGGGVLRISGADNSAVSGGDFFVNNGTLRLTNPLGGGGGLNNTLGGSDGWTLQLGATSGTAAATIEVGNSGSIANNISVRAGSSGTKTIGLSGAVPVNYTGIITANDNLRILNDIAGTAGNITTNNSSNSVASGKTVTFSNTNTGVITDSATWSGQGGMAFNGSSSGNIVVSGAKTYSGGASLDSMSGTGSVVVSTSSAGIANAPTSGSFGTGTLTIGATRIRAGTGADITLHNPITFTGGPTFATVASEKSLIFTGNADLNGAARTLTVETGSTVAGKFVEFQGVISGANGIVKAGAGTLKLSGLNTYAGNTQINTGFLLAGADDILPFGVGKTGVVINGGASTAGTLDLNGFNLNINGLTGTSDNVLGKVVNNASGTNKTLTLGNGDATGNTFSGIIADNTSGTGTIALTKTGTGSQILSGANTYTGLTTINAGALRISDPGSLGGTVAGTVVNGGTGGTGVARLELSGGITVSGESINIKGGGNFLGALSSFSGINEWAGNVTVGAAATRIGASAGATLKVSGVIDSGSNTYGLTIRTGDVNSPVVLSASNTYLGDTTIAVGKLQLNGGDNRLPVATKLIMGGGANATEFDLNGTNQEIAGLGLGANPTASNAVNNSSITASTLTVNAATSSSFGGILKGNLGLTKKGSDSLTLSGNNSYTGNTLVSSGTLYINGNISTSVLTTVQSGATLGGNNGTVGDLLIEAGGSLSPGSSPGTLTVSGDYTQYGTLIAEVTGLTPGTQHDRVLVNGAVSLNGSLSISFNAFTPANGDLIFILLNDSSDAISGSFTGLAQGAIVGNYGGFDWRISYLADQSGNSFTGGNDVALMAVPEPRAALLGGMALLSLVRRRRQ